MFATVDPEWSLRLGKKVLRYLIATREYGLFYPSQASASDASTEGKLKVPTLWGDNAASLCIADGQGSWRTRSLANKAVALRSRLDLGTLELKKVSSEEQRADGLAKVFPAPAMARIRGHFGLTIVAENALIQMVREAGVELDLEVFADASFETTCAQTGVAVFVGGMLIDWRSQRQSTTARSTAEAEITALNTGVLMLEGCEAVMASIAVGSGFAVPR